MVMAILSLSYTKKKTTQKNTRDLILLLWEENPHLTRVALAEKIGVSPDAIKQHLSKLKNEGLLETIGDRKESYWRVNV